MRHLFTPDGERALEAVMRLRPLLAFDFDGTLAPIVAIPDAVKMPKAISHRLVQLAQRRPVAIVTGRSVADVAPRLGFEPRYIVGNHGAEDPTAGTSPVGSEALESLRRSIDGQRDALRAAGVLVEDKRYSLALHYRLAPDRAIALQRIEELLHELDPALKTFGGKFVVNVAAAAAPDKGDAVASLVQRAGAGSAVFVGDDVNDEPVLRRAEPHWLTVRVDRDDPSSKAMFFLDGHGEVALLLGKMLLAAAP